MSQTQETGKTLLSEVREMLTDAGGASPEHTVQLALLLRIAKALEKDRK